MCEKRKRDMAKAMSLAQTIFLAGQGNDLRLPSGNTVQLNSGAIHPTLENFLDRKFSDGRLKS